MHLHYNYCNCDIDEIDIDINDKHIANASIKKIYASLAGLFANKT